MREGEPTGEYIWLRQSVTFTANAQTRTLEIAIPVRPGASASEVEALLAQAAAGMAQLSHTLDTRVAEALVGGSAPDATLSSATPPPRPSPSPTLPSRREEHEPTPTASAAIRETATPAPVSAGSAHPAQPPMPPSSPPSSRPAPPQPARPVPAAAARPASPPAERAAVNPGPVSTSPAGADLSRRDFLSAAAQLGLNPKEAMDHLGVRTLEGLNLREALASLQRQLLRSPSTEARPPAASSRTSPAASGSTAPHGTRPQLDEPAATAASRGPIRFEEEDEADVTFTVDEEEAPEETSVAGEDEYLLEPGELEELDSDDVPDFGPPPSRAPSTASRAPARRATPRAAAAPTTTETTPTTAVTANTTGERVRDLIHQLRSAAAGGIASAQQRTAYRNIIVNELGEANARGLIQRLWRVTPDRLGPDQYDELISWGKQDTFADDVPLVMAALDAERQAERERASGEAGKGGAARSSPPSAIRSRPGTSGTTRGEN